MTVHHHHHLQLVTPGEASIWSGDGVPTASASPGKEAGCTIAKLHTGFFPISLLVPFCMVPVSSGIRIDKMY